MSDKSVKKKSARFRAGCESLVDDPRPDQANTVIADDLINMLDDLVRSEETARTIVQKRLRYRKVCAHWVSK